MLETLAMTLRRMIVDGLVLGAVFTVVAVGSLWIDARLWIDDYPPDIRAAVGPDVVAPLGLRVATAAALVGTLLTGVVSSNWLAARERNWTPRFASVFVHTLGLFWIVNVVDIVIVDWLVLVTIRPSFAVFPGTGGLAGYADYWFHFEASVLSWQPWLGSLVLAALAGIGLPALWARKQRVTPS